MSEIEKRQVETPVKRTEPKRSEQKREPDDPTEWHPQGDRDYQRVEANQIAVHARSVPLNYGSLADFEPGVIAGIEARARGDLIRTMEQQGVTVDERAVRPHWQLVVEGYGFPYPEGFVHPEAPDEVKAEGKKAWKRAVEIAADSVAKGMFVQVWRRRRGQLPSEQPKQIEGGTGDIEVVKKPDGSYGGSHEYGDTTSSD